MKKLRNWWYRRTIDISNEELINACREGNYHKAKWLLEHGANVNATNNEGWTPLHQSCYHKHLEITKLLLEHGANINVANNNGWTPLHSSCRHGRFEVTKLLLKHRADTTLLDIDRTTALSYLTPQQREEIEAYIQELEKKRMQIITHFLSAYKYTELSQH